jgi:hypothetical protein
VITIVIKRMGVAEVQSHTHVHRQILVCAASTFSMVTISSGRKIITQAQQRGKRRWRLRTNRSGKKRTMVSNNFIAEGHGMVSPVWDDRKG